MLNLEPIKARLAGATPGPWEQDTEQIGKRSKPVLIIWAANRVVCRVGTVGFPKTEEDAAFIEHAPADIAALLEEVERLRAVLKEGR